MPRTVRGAVAAPSKPTRAEAVSGERRRRRGAVENTGHRLLFDKKLLDEEKYVYRVINDDGVKLHRRTVEDDYDLVPDPSKTIKTDGTDLGSMASVVVGRTESGQPIRGYLARKLRTDYEQDQAAKRVQNEQTMRAISQPQIPANRLYTPDSRNYEDEQAGVAIR